jgi:CubicO group peptidase (beta-lactamase class C family)
MKKTVFFLTLSLFFSLLKAQNLYFPPLTTSVWETTSPDTLGWCKNKIDTLYQFLQQENTKGFIVLKDGKIVLEKYFGTFTKDSLWYWASAGKTITSFLVGKAQEEGSLSILDTSSKYLGKGWTNCTPAQEDKISIRNQLNMTSGLDDGVPDNHCILDSCLNYLADAGNRWAYHNAPYTLLEKVLTSATKQTINKYTASTLLTKTGMTGLWYTVDYDNVFFSKVRSMARFGLLIQNRCIWNTDKLLSDTAYINQMTNTSQTFNKSYGYLWWLNGKQSYMVPGLQTVIPGSYAPHAPADMFAGIGKNGQLVCISRNTGLVVVRMGDAPGSFGEVPTLFCDEIWQKLNDVMCNSTSLNEGMDLQNKIVIYPNPAQSELNIMLPVEGSSEIEIINMLGERVIKVSNQQKIDINQLQNGIYYLRITSSNKQFISKFIKQ